MDFTFDHFPRLMPILDRMQRLTLDSSIRECLAIRDDWRGCQYGISTAFEDSESVTWLIDSVDFICRVHRTPAFKNYRTVTRELFGQPERRRLAESEVITIDEEERKHRPMLRIDALKKIEEEERFDSELEMI